MLSVMKIGRAQLMQRCRGGWRRRLFLNIRGSQYRRRCNRIIVIQKPKRRPPPNGASEGAQGLVVIGGKLS
jgi:hypothetical protein